jgi:outer membrane protein assembly factor BamB
MAGWSPARPERVTPGWNDEGSGQSASSNGDPSHRRDDFEEATAGPFAALPPRRRRRRVSAVRRVLLGYAALATVVLVISGLGTALTPAYGSLPSWNASPVADLREAPMPGGWSTDLAREILPGVPVRCASFTASSGGGPLVLVTATAPSFGSSTNCSALTSGQVASTIGLLDTETGAVLWSRNLSLGLTSDPNPVRIDSAFVAEEAGAVLVQYDVNGDFTVLSLSLRTGAVLGSATLPPIETSLQPTVVGTLVLYGGSTSREGATSWTLADLRHLTKPLWTGILNDATPPALTSGALFATIAGTSERIDGSTGKVTRFGDGTVDLTSTATTDHTLVTTQVLPSGVVVTAWNDKGRTLWQRGGVGAIAGTSRDCVLVSLPGTTKLTCLDAGSGRARWTTDVGGGASPGGVVGQTTNDVVVYGSSSIQTDVTMLDGDTGSVKYRITLPPATYITATARTTAYLATRTAGEGVPGITAFDVESGRRLWARTDSSRASLQLWGGRLLSLSPSGVATELTNRSQPVLGG